MSTEHYPGRAPLDRYWNDIDALYSILWGLVREDDVDADWIDGRIRTVEARIRELREAGNDGQA